MNFYATLFTLTLVCLLMCVQRAWAPVTLLFGVCVTLSQKLEIAGLNFPVIRVLIAAGLLRALMRGERPARNVNGIDLMMVLWLISDVLSLLFHSSSVLAFRLGTAYDVIGVYYLMRVFIREENDIRTLFKGITFLILPISVTMLIEKLAGFNVLGAIGFAGEAVVMTNNHYRAAGPFGHPILAGNVGSVCLPMGIYLWRVKSRFGLLCIGAALGMVFASGSSGPIITMLAVLVALGFWKLRFHMRLLRWLALFVIIALDLVMSDPVYFLIARIDITGGSTGYFRAQLIRSSIEHLGEWWLAGTDFTRHWMPSGIDANADHTDMTNYYVQMGVWGGLPLMLLFMGVLAAGFVRVGKALRLSRSLPVDQFLVWTMGSILFGHVTTFMSISYFDQTIVFLSLSLACLGSLRILRPRTWTPAHKNASPRGRARATDSPASASGPGPWVTNYV